jgi:phage host-nuclease inhibitor protein Gam
MPNLYELGGDYKALQEAMDRPDVTQDEIAVLITQLDETRGELRDKVDALCRVLANVKGNAEKFAAEEARLAKRRKSLENSQERIRNWIRASMDMLDVKKISTNVHTVSISPGQPKVVVVDESVIPEEYVRVKREIDKKAVMDTYNNDGEIVPGCDIINGEPRLLIR